MKGRQGIVAGYNAQAMVSPTETGGATGMLVTAVDVVDAANDNALLVPMVDQAEETTGTRAHMMLADAGYFAASPWHHPHPSRSAGGGVRVTATVPQRPISQGPIHLQRASDSFTMSAGTDAQVRSYTARDGVPLRLYRASGAVCQACPAFENLYQGQGDWAKLSHRTARRSAAVAIVPGCPPQQLERRAS